MRFLFLSDQEAARFGLSAQLEPIPFEDGSITDFYVAEVDLNQLVASGGPLFVAGDHQHLSKGCGGNIVRSTERFGRLRTVERYFEEVEDEVDDALYEIWSPLRHDQGVE